MKRRGIVSLALAGVLASALSLAASAPASANDPVYAMHNFGNSMCLQPINGTQDAGAEVVQEPCNSSTEQRWVFHPLGGTKYRIENEHSLRCLDAAGGATNGTPVVQWPCASISNQTWDTGVTLAGFPILATVKSRISGTTSHCLDVPGGQLSMPGLAIQIWGCNRTNAQNWILS
jgi:hypothetical protein